MQYIQHDDIITRTITIVDLKSNGGLQVFTFTNICIHVKLLFDIENFCTCLQNIFLLYIP